MWRLDTTDGSWAVKVPFDADSRGRGARRRPRSTRRRTPRACRRRRCGGPRTGAVFADGRGPAGQGVRVGGPAALPTRRWIRRWWVRWWPPSTGSSRRRTARWTRGTTNRSVPIAGTSWSSSCSRPGAPFAAGWPTCATSWSRWSRGSSRRATLRTCHRDLWADNVLPTADGGVCVIDWENSGPADPSQELGCVLFEFARNDPGRARALHRRLPAAGGPARGDRRGHFSMLIAQLGHITEIAATDWLEPNPRSPERADSEAWICEVLDEPHTRDAARRPAGRPQGPMIGGIGSYGAQVGPAGQPGDAGAGRRSRCGSAAGGRRREPGRRSGRCGRRSWRSRRCRSTRCSSAGRPSSG